MRRLLPLLLIAASPVIADHNWDHRNIDAGRSLYADQCAACHGANLEGQPDWRTAGPDGVLPAPPHDGTGHTWHHDDQLLFDYTKYGGQITLEAMGIAEFTSGMPGFEGTLTDDEIWDTLAFIRSTWTDRERGVQASRNPPH